MASLIEPLLDSFDTFFAWVSTVVKQTTESYCEIQTADDKFVLVANDGSLLTVLRVHGATGLIGEEEFTRLHQGFSQTLQSPLSRAGHHMQVFFSYDLDAVREQIEDIYEPAKATKERLHLALDDLFTERVNTLSDYCAKENTFLVLSTRPSQLSREQFKSAAKEKARQIHENKIPPFRFTQNVIAAIPELREVHDAFIRYVQNDLQTYNVSTSLLEVHEALYEMRMTVDPEFTDRSWRPVLPGDKIPVKMIRKARGDVSDILWPSLSQQLMPRDTENLNLRIVRIGDRIYSSIFIDLFPKDLRAFNSLFSRVLPTKIPWRISFSVESDAIGSLRFKSMLAKILSFSSAQNRLLSSAVDLLNYYSINTDEAIVKLRVAASTWAPVGDLPLLRHRHSELTKAIQGWGSCDVSEISGDPFAGAVSSMLGISFDNVAVASVAPISDVVYMLPLTRPASPWETGALLFRSPDGKPWPYQPGSRQQTTWIDLMFARPGSGKSVLSNALNLAMCLSGGIQRLPRIAIIDVGPSSSGLISLLSEALPAKQRHLVAYHRLRMTPDYSVNPFDTQLGSRFPTPQERGFLVNFITLLATPVGAEAPYEGISDMAGLVVDELYKSLADDASPHNYTPGIEPLVDGILEEIGFVQDEQTSWWEVTDALFNAGFAHEAMLAQRFAMPLLADAASICRTQTVEDLYGKIIAPTGEPLIATFARMVSSAVREYPILARVTVFDIGDARVVSLDLDEVAKGGGDASERQTAIMYMLARYVLANHFYLTQDNVEDMPEAYRNHHFNRITEIREDPKRIIYDEFHRTSKSRSVRDQVILDMREGRKWNVQIALISQALEDFDPVMVDFATSVYVMDAGPAQTIKKTAEVFGLSETAIMALRTRVHGPRKGGSTFLAQFSTKAGINTQLLSLTLGPVELWAFSTTAEDVAIRNKLYSRLGPAEARRVLATIFPNGTVTDIVEKRLLKLKEEEEFISEDANLSVIDTLVEEILTAYAKNPKFQFLPV